MTSGWGLQQRPTSPITKKYNTPKITRSSADADKPARRVYSGYGFLLVFYRNFVPNTIRLQKCRDLENRVRGSSRSLVGWHVVEISPVDRAHTTSYWRSVVTMALLVSFLRYSMSKNVVTLKSGSEVTQGHRKCYY